MTKVEYGKNLLLKGVPIIFNKGGAKLKIGENVTIKSSRTGGAGRLGAFVPRLRYHRTEPEEEHAGSGVGDLGKGRREPRPLPESILKSTLTRIPFGGVSVRPGSGTVSRRRTVLPTRRCTVGARKATCRMRKRKPLINGALQKSTMSAP